VASGGETKAAVIARLMAEGLDHYGQDRVERAVESWREVLRLDPGHSEARDYLRSAGYEGEPAGGGAARDGHVLEAAELARSGQLDEALALLDALARRHPGDLHVHGYVELARAALHRRVLEALRGGSAVPRLRLGSREILRFNLPADAGFVLSMVDGTTPAADLVALSGMDPFDVLRALQRLLEAGILELAA
jgi:hypothetical protein